MRFSINATVIVIGTVLGLLVVVLATLVLLHWHPSAKPVRYTVRGIDVSHHQGVIDWRKVAGGQVRFAYLKASEGADWRDPSFATNLRDARRSGIAVGAYHYFTFCSPGGVQARSFLQTVPVGAINLPPVVDLEYVGNCARRPTREAFARELRAFLHLIEARYRTRPVLYSAQAFFDAYLVADAFAPYPLWIRDLAGVARLPTKRKVLFRQFSERGSIPGIKGPVDEDLYMGAKEDFSALLRFR
jgi:lysozyme